MWAFATARHSDVQLFAGVARALERRVADLNLQDLANIVWAFATTAQREVVLLAASARAMERR